MSKTLFFGDVHFSTERAYHYAAGNLFIDFLNSLPENNSDNTAVFLGDLTEAFIIDGRVVKQLLKMFEALRFKHTYILVGNHDIKKRKGVEHLVYEFLANQPNVTILSRPGEEISIEGLRVLSLPHYNPQTGFPLMYDLYDNNPFSGPYDYVIGHLTDNSIGAFGRTADLSKIDTRKIILGHIHTRSNDKYIGSVYSLNPLQNDRTRAVWVVDNSSRAWSEIALPEFVTFHEVEFPNPLPITTARIPVWTIFNCFDESLIESTYGKNLFIRQINVKPRAVNADQKKKEDFKMSFSNNKSTNPLVLISELMRSSSKVYDRGAVSILKKIFSDT